MGPPSESDPPPASDTATFEREKWVAELALRQHELEIREREQRRLDTESSARLEEMRRSRWSSPLVLAILGAALATLGNVAVSWLNGVEQRNLETDRANATLQVQEQNNKAQQSLEEFKADSARLLQMIGTSDPDKAAANLQFLLDVGLVSNANTAARLKESLANREPGQGPALPAAGSVPILGTPGPGGPALGSYNAAPRETTVSGVSAGAFMAVQLATAFSSTIKGVGVIAGGPFGCASGSMITALSTCMAGSPPPNVDTLLAQAKKLADAQAIDPLPGLARQNVYVFHGYNDKVVDRAVTDAVVAFYRRSIGPGAEGKIFYQTAIGAGHSQVTVAYGGACNVTGGEFINNCNYDQAGVILQLLYGPLAERNAGKPDGKLLTFDQGRYTTRDPETYNLGDTGYLYVPDSCARSEACRVHVVLHGCGQDASTVSDTYVRHAGYNEWADNNRIIVLYPQSRALPTNPKACWDWWGFEDPSNAYLTQQGQQMATIMAMVRRVTADFRPVPEAVPASASIHMDVVIVDVSDSAAALVWRAVPRASAYKVYRRNAEDAPFVEVHESAGTNFTDSGLLAATDYAWQISAVVDGHEGERSYTVTARTRDTTR
ncbi:MAG TPA: PHB depolymerase family esterase [Bryobacteraceae bacterium]|nr:PHB depolymerase family esterase [Bryobacteraceae bacterium]